jgi:septal ring factor EnvC (AmiA/AmiB activator)
VLFPDAPPVAVLQPSSSKAKAMDQYNAVLPAVLGTVTAVGAGAGATAYVMSHSWTLAQGTQRSLDAVKSDVSETKTAVAVLQTNMTTLDGRMEKMEKSLEKMEKSLGNLEKSMGNLEKKTENLEKKTENLQQQQFVLSLLLTVGMGYIITRLK